MRIQLALNVRNLETAVDFYEKLFGVPVHKRRPGYANFAIENPPLKLVLFEAPDAPERLDHLGVEVGRADELAGAARRLRAEGLAGREEEGVLCCHAVQDKVWSDEPDGLRWEWYRVLDDDPEAPPAAPPVGACCA